MARIRGFLLSAIGGLALLAAANLLRLAWLPSPGWSALPISVCAALGLPGALALLLVSALSQA